MIDAQSGDLAFRDQFERAAIARFEHFRIFDAHSNQIGHIEKSAIVDLLAGDAPVREAIPLRVEQRIERVWLFVDPFDPALERIAK